MIATVGYSLKDGHVLHMPLHPNVLNLRFPLHPGLAHASDASKPLAFLRLGISGPEGGVFVINDLSQKAQGAFEGYKGDVLIHYARLPSNFFGSWQYIPAIYEGLF